MATVYENIWNKLRNAVELNFGVTFDAHETLELLGVLESYEESRELLKHDYQQVIDSLRAERNNWLDTDIYSPTKEDYYQVTVLDLNTGESWADHWRYSLTHGWVPSTGAREYQEEFHTNVKAIAYRDFELYQSMQTENDE